MVRNAQARDGWERCGATILTGDADGSPLDVASPAPQVVDGLLEPWGLDSSVLTERARLLGLTRGGRTSCGGASRLFPSADGWIALALSRPSDRDLLPAWLGAEVAPTAGWDVVEQRVRRLDTAHLVTTATELGLPCSAVGEVIVGDAPPPPPDRLPDLSGVLVVDLSALWAGPLCAELLLLAGASVVKVEDPARPDGARAHPAFYDLMNGGKASVAADLTDPDGRDSLRRLMADADVVVTSARQRAFAQLGLGPDDVLGRSRGPLVWVAITAHGWGSGRVGFGDDAAAAGGLVAVPVEDPTPRFAADAIADPLTGVVAAVRALHACSDGTTAVLDCPLAGTAAALRPTGPAQPRPGTRATSLPARRPPAPARALGADTIAVLKAGRP